MFRDNPKKEIELNTTRSDFSLQALPPMQEKINNHKDRLDNITVRLGILEGLERYDLRRRRPWREWDALSLGPFRLVFLQLLVKIQYI